MGDELTSFRSQCSVLSVLLLLLLSLVPALANIDASLTLGSDVPPAAATQLKTLLSPFLETSPSPSLHLVIGRSSLCDGMIPAAELAALAPESFIIRSSASSAPSLVTAGMATICVAGNPLPAANASRSTVIAGSSIGVGFGAFHLLQLLGFHFLHPLAPGSPDDVGPGDVAALLPLNVIQEPRFPFRAFHTHTEHPLELVDLLQGSDAILGSNDTTPHGETTTTTTATTTTVLPWSAMLPEFDAYLTWCLGNKVNRVEWVLLTTPEWKASGFVNSTLRRSRLRTLAMRARAFGVLVGVDVPIAEIQQHGWYMVDSPTRGGLAAATKQIEARLEWLLGTEASGGPAFDFLATESGFTEFTHPDCTLMLGLMNAVADTSMSYRGGSSGSGGGGGGGGGAGGGVPTYIKCHSSTGQVCKDYKAPWSPNGSEPVNFNFLPHFASTNLSVLPHPVEVYGLDDPTANVYGNENYSGMLTFLTYEAKLGKRQVVYHPETNYWVNVDIDVPLFLPLYGERRLHDLRLLEAATAGGTGVRGQNIFDSGWEWGAWLSDVVAAQAAWNSDLGTSATGGPVSPPLSSPSSPSSPRSALSSSPNRTASFRAALQPLRRAIGRRGSATADALVDLIVRLTDAQARLLIYGDAGAGTTPPTPAELDKLSGIAYLSGMDAMVGLLAKIKPHAITQPRCVGFWDHSDALYPRVAPLLAAMNQTFTGLAGEFERLLQQQQQQQQQPTVSGGESSSSSSSSSSGSSGIGGAISASVVPLIEELADSVRLLALRAAHVKTLYAASAPGVSSSARAEALRVAKDLIAQAAAVVARREAEYRVQPAERIAGWRPQNPTAYAFGYVWTVHSLYYWWRDYGLVERKSLDSRIEPCYLNIEDTTDCALGFGRNISREIRQVLSHLGLPGNLLGTCLSPPETAYEFPRDLYRSR